MNKLIKSEFWRTLMCGFYPRAQVQQNKKMKLKENVHITINYVTE